MTELITTIHHVIWFPKGGNIVEAGTATVAPEQVTYAPSSPREVEV